LPSDSGTGRIGMMDESLKQRDRAIKDIHESLSRELNAPLQWLQDRLTAEEAQFRAE
jgi:hypothetical protein